MRHALRLGSLAIAASVLIAPVHAQAHPTLDGTWVLNVSEAPRTTIVAESGDAAFKVGDMGSGWGTTLTLTTRGDRLLLEYHFFVAYDGMAPLRYEFALDGRETLNEVVIGPGVTRLQSRTAWRGDTLVIVTRQPVPPEVGGAGVMAEVQRALVLTAPDALQITTTRVGVAGAPTNRVTTTYTRKR
ncbi:MAG: hypothetical protein K2R93_02155 [Gemmatimonadaceae bacterium]|nr:hypothetical protein [Gemmatimonadaceae bacterium]